MTEVTRSYLTSLRDKEGFALLEAEGFPAPEGLQIEASDFSHLRRWHWHNLVLTFITALAVACAPPENPIPPANESAEIESAQTASSQRMARRLALIANDTAQDNVFMNADRLAVLRKATLPEDPVERIRLELDLANECLRAGLSEEAAKRLDDVLEKVEADPSVHPAGLARRVRSLLAIAHLRVGEQENCLLQHNPDACLLPIRESGQHQLEKGSRAALAVLEELLEEDARDVSSLWLYNVAAMTVGEYPDGVPEAWRVPPEAFDSDFDVGRFIDIAHHVGLASHTATSPELATSGLAGGVVVDDFNGDDLLDVLVSSWNLHDPIRFFQQLKENNKGILRFEERTQEAGLDGLNGGLNLVHADYDNDGDVDVLVLRGAWLRHTGRHPNSLLRNDDGVFVDVTEEVGLLSFHPTQTAAWGDFDNDGWLDLFIGNESTPGEPHPSELYRNNGAAGLPVTFTEMAADAGVTANAFVKGATWADLDNDGWQDLYLSTMRGPNLLYWNDAGPNNARRFVEAGKAAGVVKPDNSFPTWAFDFDNDGWLDLFASGYGKSFLEADAAAGMGSYFGTPNVMEHPRLYRNLGNRKFQDVTVKMGLDQPLLGMGANFGDLDNDGWLDFYIGTGAPDYRALVPNRMYRNSGSRNSGSRSFQDVTTSGGFGHLQKGHGVAFADIDGDGDQDVFAVMGGAFSGDVYPNVLFENPGHGRSWVVLRLVGTTSNRSAIGARIRLTVATPSGPRDIYATVTSGGSFGASPLARHIGLGDATEILQAEIRWPGGQMERFPDLTVNTVLEIRQGTASR